MVLDQYRKGAGEAFAPTARALHRAGVTPNALTAFSFVTAVAAGLVFFLSSPAHAWLVVLAAFLVLFSGWADILDGQVARLGNGASAKGDFLDHVADRYSDVAILLGIALSQWTDVRWGLAAIVGTFLTSYMGTQAQALGLGRNYSGLLGRADRMVILMIIPLLAYAHVELGLPLVLGVSYFTIALAYFAIVGNLTALQRFWFGWRELSQRERDGRK